MKLVPETTDLGAPEYFVFGISDITQVAPGIIRVSLYTTREDGNFIVCHGGAQGAGFRHHAGDQPAKPARGDPNQSDGVRR
jgi:hypothetical protein